MDSPAVEPRPSFPEEPRLAALELQVTHQSPREAQEHLSAEDDHTIARVLARMNPAIFLTTGTDVVSMGLFLSLGTWLLL